MEKYNTFYIEECTIDDNSVFFRYSFDHKIHFTEEISLDTTFQKRKNIDIGIMRSLLFHSSIAFGISYYKLFPTKTIVVHSGYLDTDQQEFRRKFYINGLGEFFYENQIDFRELGLFQSNSDILHPVSEISLSENYLLPVGGGKDSIVSSLLLSEEKENITPYVFGEIDTIKQSFLEEYKRTPIQIKRKIDSLLFEMNRKGYYNGHVPITGLISFFLPVVSYLYDFKYIIFSNEKSADSGNLNFHDNTINHQYSKSAEFQDDFSEYLRKYISPDIKYSSLLRDYYEIQIAEIFAEKGKNYFSTFSSCNKNFTLLKNSETRRWCNVCPKCLFVYIILRPFISSEETYEIFGEELFEKESLKDLFLEITGNKGTKPFECVGETQEAELACYLYINTLSEKVPYLLEVFQQEVYKRRGEAYFKKLKKLYQTSL